LSWVQTASPFVENYYTRTPDIVADSSIAVHAVSKYTT